MEFHRSYHFWHATQHVKDKTSMFQVHLYQKCFLDLIRRSPAAGFRCWGLSSQIATKRETRRHFYWRYLGIHFAYFPFFLPVRINHFILIDEGSVFSQVIEYIQFLQEKVTNHEGSFQGWSQEPAKMMPLVIPFSHSSVFSLRVKLHVLDEKMFHKFYQPFPYSGNRVELLVV